MTIFIAMASQKGGVSKSTLARLVACEYANAGWSVKIADLDVSQGTSFSWQGRRLLEATTVTTPEQVVPETPV
jgi:chromosome partitioning protein